MRLVLIYPPHWKIAAPGEPPYAPGEGPPTGHEGIVLDGDLLGPPYGLLLLSAQAIRAGHSVTTLNLADFAWPEVDGAEDLDSTGCLVNETGLRGDLLIPGGE